MAKQPQSPKSEPEKQPDAAPVSLPSAAPADHSAPPQDAPDLTTRPEPTEPPRSLPPVKPSMEFRKELAAVQPGTTKFGQMPATKMRLRDALSRLINSKAHLQQAKDILDSLKAEKVTGTQQTGAEAILGDDLPQYELLIEHAEQTMQFLAGELLP